MHPLACHPGSRRGAVGRLSAGVRREKEGLRVRFVLEGDLGAIRIPPPGPPAIARGLWQHTCCEIFVARPGGAAYHEFNLSPTGEWAAHAFARYREGTMLDDASLDPAITVSRGAGKLEIQALIRLQQAKFVIGLAAVIEHADGELAYWALRHPPGKPDFHHRDAFALEL
jgi:hypothetical protein